MGQSRRHHTRMMSTPPRKLTKSQRAHGPRSHWVVGTGIRPGVHKMLSQLCGRTRSCRQFNSLGFRRQRLVVLCRAVSFSQVVAHRRRGDRPVRHGTAVARRAAPVLACRIRAVAWLQHDVGSCHRRLHLTIAWRPCGGARVSDRAGGRLATQHIVGCRGKDGSCQRDAGTRPGMREGRTKLPAARR